MSLQTSRIAGLTTVVTAIVALGPLTMSIYAPSMPSIASSLDASPGMVQLTLSVYLAGLAFGQLVYGPLSDRFGRRWVLIGGLAVFVLGSVACFLAQSIGTLIVARIVQAAGACAGPALGRAMVRDVYPRDKAARVLALVGMALAVAPAAGPVVGGYLQIAFGWHAVFVALAGVGVILLAVVVVRLPETNTDLDRLALRPRRLAGNYVALLRHRTFMGFVAPTAVALGGLFTFYGVAPFLLIDLIGLTPDQYGWTSTITVAGYVMGSFVANRLGGRVGIERMVAVSSGLTLVGAVLFAGFALDGRTSLATVVGPMVLWVFGMGMTLPNAMAGALAPFPRMAGVASALMGFLQMGAGALGSMVLARLSDGTALPPAVTLLTMAVIGCASFYLMIWRRRGGTTAAVRQDSPRTAERVGE